MVVGQLVYADKTFLYMSKGRRKQILSEYGLECNIRPFTGAGTARFLNIERAIYCTTVTQTRGDHGWILNPM